MNDTAPNRVEPIPEHPRRGRPWIMHRLPLIEERLTRSVIGAFFEVYNTLGFGFLEHLYVMALERELRERGHRVAREVGVSVLYKGRELGQQRLDMIVDAKLVVETKSTYQLHPAAQRQLYNYLRATRLELGLLFHFGPEPRLYRLVCQHATQSTVSQPTLSIDDHPLLRVAAFTTMFPAPLGMLATPPAILDALRLDAPAPLARDEGVRAAVRDLLRHGGYKPTGRGKPASEYLVRAAAEGALGTINLAVDVCNAVSLHSGFPVSVVDLGRARAPFRIGVAPAAASYVFNASGQEIDLGGLLCLFDAEGPCANAVRDAQRTKTHAGTTATLSVIWGVAGHEARLGGAERWYRGALEEAGAVTGDVTAAGGPPLTR